MLVGPAILFVSLKGMPNIGSSYNMKHIKLLYEKKNNNTNRAIYRTIGEKMHMLRSGW